LKGASIIMAKKQGQQKIKLKQLIIIDEKEIILLRCFFCFIFV
jgi:hypothetical protein